MSTSPAPDAAAGGGVAGAATSAAAQKRMLGIIAMLQSDKAELAARADSLAEQLQLSRGAAARAQAKAQAHDALAADVAVSAEPAAFSRPPLLAHSSRCGVCFHGLATPHALARLARP